MRFWLAQFNIRLALSTCFLSSYLLCGCLGSKGDSNPEQALIENDRNSGNCEDCKAVCAGQVVMSGTLSVSFARSEFKVDAPPHYLPIGNYGSYDLESFRASDPSMVRPYVFDDDGYTNPYGIPQSPGMLRDAVAEGARQLRAQGFDSITAPSWIYNSHWTLGGWVHARWPSWGSHYLGDLVTRGWTVTMFGFHKEQENGVTPGYFNPDQRVSSHRLQILGSSSQSLTAYFRIRSNSSLMTYRDGEVLSDYLQRGGKPQDKENEVLKLSLASISSDPSETTDFFLNRSASSIIGNQTLDYRFSQPVRGGDEMELILDTQDHFYSANEDDDVWIPLPVAPKETIIGGNLDYLICDEEKSSSAN